MLPVTDSLIQAGLKHEDTFIDVGSDTGYFMFPVFEITQQKVYTLYILEEMLKAISDKTKKHHYCSIYYINDAFLWYNKKMKKTIRE